MTTQRKIVAPKNPALDGLIALDENEDVDFFEKREPLFSLAGKVYEARVNFSVSEVTEYSRISRTQGIDAGIEYALTLALGKDGYEAYSGYKYLRREPAGKITDQVLKRLIGTEDDPK